MKESQHPSSTSELTGPPFTLNNPLNSQLKVAGHWESPQLLPGGVVLVWGLCWDSREGGRFSGGHFSTKWG